MLTRMRLTSVSTRSQPIRRMTKPAVSTRSNGTIAERTTCNVSIGGWSPLSILPCLEGSARLNLHGVRVHGRHINLENRKCFAAKQLRMQILPKVLMALRPGADKTDGAGIETQDLLHGHKGVPRVIVDLDDAVAVVRPGKKEGRGHRSALLSRDWP